MLTDKISRLAAAERKAAEELRKKEQEAKKKKEQEALKEKERRQRLRDLDEKGPKGNGKKDPATIVRPTRREAELEWNFWHFKFF